MYSIIIFAFRVPKLQSYSIYIVSEKKWAVLK